MSYHGPQGRGAARRYRIRKREEAEARNALTPPERRKAYRRALAIDLTRRGAGR